MTGIDYARLAATADRLIARYGAEARLLEPSAPSGPSYDPTPSTPTPHDCMAVEAEYSARDIDGTRVLATDKRFFVGTKALPGDIKPDWLLESGDVEYRIVRASRIKPGATTLLWDLQCRTA